MSSADPGAAVPAGVRSGTAPAHRVASESIEAGRRSAGASASSRRATRRGQDGSGFGLAIVERIVDAHGWDVRIDEGAAGGARIEIVT
ncbi:hypothetical protein DVK06_06515 [Halorubrum sp. Atlit-28R]|uniref:ATP-binding protein n=1 Tax=Halorubrum tropicale TaxID=1765655 RepID=UPI000EF29255|nr:hypothetical protein DVK06_06515 [Halorubrum sp. Atlit-28R]